ncbi:MAG: PilZ domain-containing protein [Chromatiaceae bacterium]
MSYGSNRHKSGTRLVDEELTDRKVIAAMFDDIQSAGTPIFLTDPGTGAAFLGRLRSVDDGRSAFTVGQVIPEGSFNGAGATEAFQMLASLEDADLTFEANRLNAGERNEDSCELRFPSVVYRLRRRKEYRGPGLGLAEVYLRQKGMPRSDAQKARLRDISDGGLGVSLRSPIRVPVEPGAVFEDSLLLLNGNPVAACAIEIRHVSKDPDVDGLIAGGRFLDLDAVSKRRISMLVTTVHSEEIRRRQSKDIY